MGSDDVAAWETNSVLGVTVVSRRCAVWFHADAASVVVERCFWFDFTELAEEIFGCHCGSSTGRFIFCFGLGGSFSRLRFDVGGSSVRATCGLETWTRKKLAGSQRGLGKNDDGNC